MRKVAAGLFLAMVLLGWTEASAQRKKYSHYDVAAYDNGTNIEYRLLETDPEKIDNIFLTFNGIGVENSHPEVLNGELNFKYLPKPYLLFRASYTIPYFDAAARDAETIGSKDGYTAPLYGNFDAGLSILPFTWTHYSTVHIPLHCEPKRAYATLYRIRLEVPQRISLGIHTGYQALNRNIEYNTTDQYGIETDWYGFNSTRNCYAGVSLVTTRHVSVDVRESHVVGRDMLGFFYADALYATDMTGWFYNGINGKTYSEPGKAGAYPEKIGYRIGFELQFQYVEKLGYSVGLEYGTRPTFKIAELPYIQGKLGLFLTKAVHHKKAGKVRYSETSGQD